MGTSIVAEDSIRGVLARVLEHVGSFFAPLNWSVLLVDSSKSALVFALAVGRSAGELVGTRVPLDEGVAGWVVRHGQPLIIEDAPSDPRFSGRVDLKTGFRTESIIAVPLRAGSKVFGVIELVNRLEGGAFSAYQLRVLSTIADFAAIGIEKAYYLAEARRLSETDHLTGCLNRRGLALFLERETARRKRYGGELSVIVADIDDFKRINDIHGHAAGDEVLRATARALRATARESDAVARYGGDEFLVVMPETGPGEAAAFRTRVADALLRASTPGMPAFTVSLGLHGSGEADFDALFAESDRDLYRRKRDPAGIDEAILQAFEDERGATGE